MGKIPERIEGVHMDTLVDRLISWVIDENGTPGSVPTRYACETALPALADVADVRIAVRRAFVDGMAFNVALAEAAERGVRA